jgi:hypothetical protein
MNRTLYFCIGVAGFLICWFWCKVGAFIYIAGTMEGTSPLNFTFIAISVIWSIILFGVLWGIFWNFRRALKP